MIDIVIAVDGFQHGSVPFYPKCVAVKEVKTGIEENIVLNLSYEALEAFQHNSEVARTFNYQKQLHGLRPKQQGPPRFAVPGIRSVKSFIRPHTSSTSYHWQYVIIKEIMLFLS